MIVIYTDGLAEPNPGIGTYGYVILKDGARVSSRHGFSGQRVTNNYAEYDGLIHALAELSGNEGDEIVVRSDSSLLVNQMAGAWKVGKKAYNNPHEGSYVEKFLEARELARKFAKLRFEWIPREQNMEADELSRVAYREALRKMRT